MLAGSCSTFPLSPGSCCSSASASPAVARQSRCSTRRSGLSRSAPPAPQLRSARSSTRRAVPQPQSPPTWHTRSATWHSSRSWSAAWPRPAGGSAAAGRCCCSASCSSGSQTSRTFSRLPPATTATASSMPAGLSPPLWSRLQSGNRGPRRACAFRTGARSSSPPPSAPSGYSCSCTTISGPCTCSRSRSRRPVSER